MKRIIVCTLLTVCFAVYSAKAQKKEFKEVIKKELSYQSGDTDHMLEVQNLNGSITVEGYDGSVVLVEVEKDHLGTQYARP
ncbi:hypothetical protein [Maribacter halichondriae]|uniref:hypothetical protein n=1 Tax=Maribacter halichondriae TaxID=2980554 RepID=UPI002358D0FD|nr:hypothetical protein [Maribacter sp. Hal144]